ncbi:reticulon-like protein B8 [Impatiens glandulifera]|uniref:reticulon-like protein B8 n=1 Tax=Impatiens glandulifera TaxID=253017 RepID=UPI001FB0D932|nr:reticulon-like protein B8 [Impatiens glandulifera]
MPERITAEGIMENIMEKFADNVPKHKSVSFFDEDKSSSVSTHLNKLFGRQKSMHKIFGGGKSADVLLWRNKKISFGVLASATVIWILFEWLNYNFMSLACFGLGLGMLAQFVWANASGLMSRSRSSVSRVALPEELFVNIAKSVGAEVNKGLAFLQDVAIRGNTKLFLGVVASLWIAAIISSWCNFLTLLYIGFVGAHTLPVVYEKNDDKVDAFVYKALDQLRNNYKKLDSSVLSRIPKGRQFKGKKLE